MDITVLDSKFDTKLYDKRRDFPFNVVTFANLKSNIPESHAYGTFVGELYRISKSSGKIEAFLLEVKLLIRKLVNQNFKTTLLHHKLSNFIRSKPACLFKYWKSLNVKSFM